MSKQLPTQLKLQLWDEIILAFDILYTEKECFFVKSHMYVLISPVDGQVEV